MMPSFSPLRAAVVMIVIGGCLVGLTGRVAYLQTYGWRRLTDGTAQALNTDWLEMRVPGNLNEVVNVALDEGFYPIYPSQGGVFHVAVTDDGTLSADAGVNGQRITLRFTQEGNGHAVTWDGSFRFGSDISVANLSVLDGKCDYVTCVYNTNGNKWDVVDVVRGFST